MAVVSAAAVGVPARAQPSGAVERRFQDQQLRDELLQLEQRQERIDQEQLITPTAPEEKEGESYFRLHSWSILRMPAVTPLSE